MSKFDNPVIYQKTTHIHICVMVYRHCVCVCSREDHSDDKNITLSLYVTTM